MRLLGALLKAVNHAAVREQESLQQWLSQAVLVFCETVRETMSGPGAINAAHCRSAFGVASCSLNGFRPLARSWWKALFLPRSWTEARAPA
jgi:hypothetical protein